MAERGSPPMRGRGLKLFNFGAAIRFSGSPPMRGRGLKLANRHCLSTLILVAPHAGAWIETNLRMGKNEQ